ncbi:MAG: BTAD domain-containing putative transcriptional regulator [Gemmatimonadales bacterium]
MIELRTLGAVELTSSDGNSVSSVLAQPRRAALLCYLALATPRGFHRRDTLFAMFWPEHDAEQARHALRQAVYFLRRALGPNAIVSRGDEEVALVAGQVRCDVREFEAALSQGRAADALALYQGELLAGFHISDAPDFERWLDAERSRLRDQAEEAAWTLAAACQQDGNVAGAVDAARRAVALATTDEIALRRLMLLLECAGDRAAAVRAYEAFTRTLRTEYQLEPSAETQVLVARIRAEPVERLSAGLSQRSGSFSASPEESSEAGPHDAPDESSSHPRGPAPEPTFVAPPSRAPRARRLVTGAVIVALLLVLAGIQLRARIRHRTAAAAAALTNEAPTQAIVVLPFTVQDNALANWREGLMDLVSMDLGGIPGIRAVDNRTVLSRWREEPAGGEDPALATSLDAAARAGGRYAVSGHVIADGPDLLLTAGVYQVAERRTLGTAESRGPADSVFALVDRLTLGILRLMPGGDARELARIDLARIHTASLPALKAFLEGEALFRRSQFERAADAYGRAVEADSTFALARYRLGISRQWFWSDLLGAVPDPLAPAVGQYADRLPPHEAAMFRAFELQDEDVLAARDLLEEEARRHPEDADTWYQLGEFYFHSGAEALVGPGSADRALAKAIALDSTFSLPYVHLIEDAIGERDTAGAERLLHTFAGVAPGTLHLSQLRLLAGLVVGDSFVRSASEAVLDTLEISRVLWAGTELAAARRWDLSERAFQTARDRAEHPPVAAIALFYTRLAQGKAGEALQSLGDPFTPQSRKARMLGALAEVGASVPAAELDGVLADNAVDSVDAVELFYVGSLAANRGQWQVVQRSLERLQPRLRSRGAPGDSSQVAFTEGLRQGLEGYVSWRQGQRDHALRLLQASQKRALGGRGVNDILRWWLGRLQLEMGRPRDALLYFESLAGSWLPADYELGRLYEQLGMAEQAREAYVRFLAPRQQADSVFQPMIQDARAALERLALARHAPADSELVPSAPRH